MVCRACGVWLTRQLLAFRQWLAEANAALGSRVTPGEHDDLLEARLFSLGFVLTPLPLYVPQA